MRTRTRRVLIAALAVLLLLALTGCGGTDDDYYEDYGEPDGEGDALLAFDGWWRRPDDYESEGFSMVDVFKVNAAEGIWTVYSDYGIAGSSFNCWADGDELTLDLEALGTAVFYHAGGRLTDEYGSVEFVRGEPAKTGFMENFVGRWYKNGDVNDDCYLLAADGSYELYSAYDPEEPAETGTWMPADVMNMTEDDAVMQTQLELEPHDDTNIWGGGDFVLAEDGLSMRDDFLEIVLVKESAIGASPAGSLGGGGFGGSVSAPTGTWIKNGYAGDGTLQFDGDAFALYNGDGELEQQGTWSSDDDCVELHGDDDIDTTLYAYGGGKALVDKDWHVYYLDEAEMETLEGARIMLELYMQCYKWRAPDDSGLYDSGSYLVFGYDGSFYRAVWIDRSARPEYAGEWSFDIDEQLLTLTFEDGTEEAIQVAAEGFRVDYYDAFFEPELF